MARKKTKPVEEVEAKPEVAKPSGWDYPHFEIDREIVDFHNDTASNHVGNHVTHVMASKITSMAAIVRQQNLNVEKAKSADIYYTDMVGMFNSLVRSFAGSMRAHCHDAINALNADHTNIQNLGLGMGIGQADVIPLVQRLIVACGLKALPLDGMDSPTARASLMLPQQIRSTLGLDVGALQHICQPQNIVKVQLLEQYLAHYQRLFSYYSDMYNNYKYVGNIPEEPRDPELGVGEPEVVNWSNTEHTIEV